MSALVMSTETEYGIYSPSDPGADPVDLSCRIVDAYSKISRRGTQSEGSEPVRWDYTAEDPLNDLRGMRLTRAAADPSMLTDDPYHLAPSGGSETLPLPRRSQGYLPAAVSSVLTNGARLYVDHAHPEYSAPETTNARDGVLWDRAGEVIARRMMAAAREAGEDIVLVKNNTDGKGAAYGTHENYQISRTIDLDDLVRGLTPFFVTRPVICGAGRVGIGQRSEVAGFQLSQRADFVENEVGLETTFNRPIINTRDEAHANPAYYRRLHVIGGDGNQFDSSIFLRLGTTALVLKAIEAGLGMEWDALALDDPVQETWNISHDPTLTYQASCAGGARSALDIQKIYLELVHESLTRAEVALSEEEELVMRYWEDILSRMSSDLLSVATEVEWVGKYQLFDRQRARLGTCWDDPRLAAMDLQWADLREDRSLVVALERAGRVKRMFTAEQVEHAADWAPENTRAYLRGYAVRNLPALAAASWTSLCERRGDHMIRRPLVEAAGIDATLLADLERGTLIRAEEEER